MKQYKIRSILLLIAAITAITFFLLLSKSVNFTRKPLVFFQTHSTIPPVSQTFSQTVLQPKRLPIRACRAVSYNDLNRVPTTTYGIPLIIHQIYKDSHLPNEYVTLVRGCSQINADFQHILWTDDVSDKFVERFYPQYHDLYCKYKKGIEKSDFLRVLFLYHFGGVYLDLDMECVKPLSHHLDQFKSSAILDKERELQTRLLWNRNSSVMNSAMMAKRHHPFFKFLLDKFNSSLHHGHALWKTGPFFVHKRLLEYRQLKNDSDSVFVAPPKWFSPMLDPYAFPVFNLRCPKYGPSKVYFYNLGCIDWKKLQRRQENITVLKESAILMHRFFHFGHQEYQRYINLKTDICQTGLDVRRLDLNDS